MYNVNLKVLTTINNPGRRAGRAVIKLEYVKKTGEKATLNLSGSENYTTQYRLTLLGIVKALERLNTNCNVTIQTYCEYIANMITTGRVQHWEENGWKTSKNEEVANIELWQQLAREMKQHNISVELIEYEPALIAKFKVIEEAGGYKIGDLVEFCCPAANGKTVSGSGKVYGFGYTGADQLIIYIKQNDGNIEAATLEYIKKLESTENEH